MTERYTGTPGKQTNGFTSRTIRILYGWYALLSFFVCAMAALVSAAIVPGLERRRRCVSAAARCWFMVAGIRMKQTGLADLPPGHCVVVANHASYLDGVILQACLPPRFSFVIKGEMQKVPLAGFLLRRIGSRFVDRFVASRSSRDARNLLKAASNGESLAVFPEGTFIAQPGLQRFRAGAFAAAIKGQLPVVPVGIRGSRHILPAKHALPRRGPLRIDVLAPIEPGTDPFADSKSLAQAARRSLLALIDEPDLAGPDPAGAPGFDCEDPGLQSVGRCE